MKWALIDVAVFAVLALWILVGLIPDGPLLTIGGTALGLAFNRLVDFVGARMKQAVIENAEDALRFNEQVKAVAGAINSLAATIAIGGVTAAVAKHYEHSVSLSAMAIALGYFVHIHARGLLKNLRIANL